MYWSPSSRTALAEAELEYDDNHKCTAAFVKMPFVRLPQALKDNSSLKSGSLSAVIWTTTPWTLPANKAVAVNKDIEYSVISLSHPSVPSADSEQDFLLTAKERVEHLMSHLPEDTVYTTIVDSVSGSGLVDGKAACANLFSGSESPILQADFVTATSGTGLVHSAPGHGMEDYQLCQEHNIGPAFAPVDGEGRFTADAFPAGGQDAMLRGLDVQAEGVKAVLSILQDPKQYLSSPVKMRNTNFVLASHEFTHKNPIDWRTKQPVIVRATAQWFAEVSVIKERAFTALEDVRFVPDSGKGRLQNFVEGRSQWCISRQRAWGVPIPVLYHQETGEVCIRQESIDHIIETIKQKGTDAWFSDPPDDPSWIHPSLAEDPWVRGKDTMDVWFDSGTTWTTLDERPGRPVSDAYVEGTDQHRGWFQSSLLTCVATQDHNNAPKAPFAELITHGFTLDGEGRKMSKSLGNVISPDQILDGSLLPPVKLKKQRGKPKDAAVSNGGQRFDAMGPDVLRLWVASSDYTRDVSVSVPVLQSVQQALQKLRVTFRFLLGVLGDYHRAVNILPDKLTFADRAALHQLSKTSKEVWESYNKYMFYKGVNAINTFVSNDLSAFYFETIKDKMYAGSLSMRKSTQIRLLTISLEMMKMLGPITPHLIEEVWEHAPPGLKDAFEHPLKSVWEGPYPPWSQREKMEAEINAFQHVSAVLKLAQEQARNAGKLGSGLACKVEVVVPNKAAPVYKDFLGQWFPDVEEWMDKDEQWMDAGELADMLVVSQAIVKFDGEESDAVNAEWSFEQSFDTQGTNGKGKVIVMPPEKEKCVRCWKFTAEENDVPCQRCQEVLEMMRRKGG